MYVTGFRKWVIKHQNKAKHLSWMQQYKWKFFGELSEREKAEIQGYAWSGRGEQSCVESAASAALATNL